MSTPAVSVREWTDVVRRARLGKTTKYIALMLATYADYRDGSRVWPGLVRVAWMAEVDYKTAQKGVRELLAAGLIEPVRGAGVRGQGVEYRLILGEELMERVDVPSPAIADLEIERRSLERRRSARGQTTGRDVRKSEGQPTGRDVLDDSGFEGQPTPRPQPGEGQPTPRPEDSPPGSAIPSKTATRTTTPHSDSDLRTAVTAPGARDREQDQISTSDPDPPPLPERCAHGLKARTRPDGSSSCALCRKAASAASHRDNVVPFPARTA